MLRTILRLTPTAIFPIFEHRNEYDYDMRNKPPETVPETGFDRVKKMFFRNEYDEVSIELTNVAQSTLCGAFFGACLGGFVHSRNAYLYFIENNQASIFKSTFDAKKKLQDFVTIAFAKGAYHWGWRVGVFTGLFSLISTMVYVYRGDTSLVEYISAGALTGGLYRCNLGVAATCVGAGLGAVLSAIAGSSILLLLKLTGFSMHDIRMAMYNVNEARKDQFNQALEKSATIKNDSLTQHHDSIVEEKGKKLEELV